MKQVQDINFNLELNTIKNGAFEALRVDTANQRVTFSNDYPVSNVHYY